MGFTLQVPDKEALIDALGVPGRPLVNGAIDLDEAAPEDIGEDIEPDAKD